MDIINSLKEDVYYKQT